MYIWYHYVCVRVRVCMFCQEFALEGAFLSLDISFFLFFPSSSFKWLLEIVGGLHYDRKNTLDKNILHFFHLEYQGGLDTA